MIPKTIHYCWFGGKPLPNDVKKCIKSWKKYCPDYEINQWDESNYDVNKHLFMRDAYKDKCWAFVSDYARLDLIYTYGGIYLDTDVELKKNLDFLRGQECYFGVQQDGHFINTGLGFGAVKQCPAVKKMLDVYDEIKFDLNNKNELACPFLNTNALLSYNYEKNNDQIQLICGANIYPPKYFDPLSPGDTQNLLCDDTVSIHHYSATWLSTKLRLKRKLVRFIGEKRVLKIKKIFKKNK